MILTPSIARDGALSNPAAATPRVPPAPFALPLFAHTVQAGFPSPAEEYAECSLDLNRYLVSDPDATRFVTVPDAALHHRGIREGDLLAIHLGLPPRPGDLVWAELDGERLLRELRRQGPRWWLHAHHPDFPPIRPGEGQALHVLGVVTAMVRALYPVAGYRPQPMVWS